MLPSKKAIKAVYDLSIKKHLDQQIKKLAERKEKKIKEKKNRSIRMIKMIENKKKNILNISNKKRVSIYANKKISVPIHPNYFSMSEHNKKVAPGAKSWYCNTDKELFNKSRSILISYNKSENILYFYFGSSFYSNEYNISNLFVYSDINSLHKVYYDKSKNLFTIGCKKLLIEIGYHSDTTTFFEYNPKDNGDFYIDFNGCNLIN